jgi:hypothetical protein
MLMALCHELNLSVGEVSMMLKQEIGTVFCSLYTYRNDLQRRKQAVVTETLCQVLKRHAL